MTDAPKTYKIRELSDFFDVPIGRIDDCLAEFRNWIGAVCAVSAFLKAIDAETERPYFVWIDDGKRDVSVTLTDSDGNEVKFDLVATEKENGND